MTSTVEGRERYGIRLRYPLELRNNPEKIKNIYVATPNGTQVPLGDLVEIKYEQGPQSIKSEDGFLVGYVLFDREEGFSEVELVKEVKKHDYTLVMFWASWCSHSEHTIHQSVFRISLWLCSKD